VPTNLLQLQTRIFLVLLAFFCTNIGYSQLFQDDFGTGFASISTVNWPSACRGGTASSFNTSIGPCAGAGDYEYGLSGFGSYITTSAIAIPATGYELTFDFSFSNTFSFPTIEIRSGASCGTSLLATTTLTNTAGVCTPQTVNLDAYSGQTIYIRFRSNTSSATFYFDDPTVDVGSGGGTSCLLADDFGTAFASINTTNWPSACRGGTASSFNTSVGACSGAGDYGYSLSGFGSYITSGALAITSGSFQLTFDYSFSNAFSFPTIEIRSGASCGTSLLATTTLTNTSGTCTPQSISLAPYSGQTIYIRFRSNTSSATFNFDDVNVCGTASPTGDFQWADNLNDNDLILDYTGTSGNEACTGCGTWTLGGGATLELVPSGGWNGNSVETEAFVASMANVYYAKLDRNEYIESPTIDMSGQESVKISFYAKSSSSGTGGGDTWSFSDRLRLQIWDGSAWITVQSMRDDLVGGWSGPEDYISSALPFNYYCFTAYKSTTSPGNYYYSSSPNVNSSYFTSDFKFRVLFEGGFSGSPFAWVDDFTFRADADGYTTMVPCGLSFWNDASATSYGQDPGTTGNNNAEKGVELELGNSINIPPLWASEANDGDTITQVFGLNESERVVYSVISEQKIAFAFPKVHFYELSTGWQSAVMSIDNNYTGPGWKYYSVQYVSCDLASGTIMEPSTDLRYYFSFEYGNEFMPVFYHLNTSGIEFGGGATSSLEVFNGPDVGSSDNCGLSLPIEMLSFSAYQEKQHAVLKWTTGSEINNDYFVVFKSTDGSNFLAFDTINGAGSSAGINEYELLDRKPYVGVSYYQLKQVDFNGDYTNSQIIALRFSAAGAVPISPIFPNPASNNVSFIYNGVSSEPIQIKLIEATGRVVKTLTINQLAKGGTYTCDLSDLNSGVYQIIVSQNQAVTAKTVSLCRN